MAWARQAAGSVALLSLVVITRNEADRIARCLASVPFADERLVLDCGSTDGTPEIAEACGARVVRTDWPGFVAQKSRALTEAMGDWVLSLDADEHLDTDAADAARRAVAEPGAACGFSFARSNVWLGTPLRHGRWYPDRRVRLVRRDHGRWVGDDPHDRLDVSGPVVDLGGHIVHTPYRSLEDHLGTIGRYSVMSAASLHARGVRAGRVDVVVRPAWHLVNAVILRSAWRDGVPGVVVAGLGATHTMCKWWSLWRLQQEAP